MGTTMPTRTSSRHFGLASNFSPILSAMGAGAGPRGRSGAGARVRRLEDAVFASLLTETALAQLVTHELDEADRAAFAPLLVDSDESSFAKVDCSAIAELEALEGVFVASTVTLLHRHPVDGYRALAIRVGRAPDGVVLPDGSEAWELAKYFAMQGAGLIAQLVLHPRLHFPAETVQSALRVSLPNDHVLAQLLEPHAASSEVTESTHKPLPSELMAALPLSITGVRQAFLVGMRGLDGSAAYPAWHVESQMLGSHTRYGRYRRDWFDALFEFTSTVLRSIPANDPAVARWADAVACWQPSFANGRRIFAGDTLARLAALHLATVTVFHSADHASCADIAIELMPMRLRVPPPDGKRIGGDRAPEPSRLDLDALVTPEDYERQAIARDRCIAPRVEKSIRDVRYAFRHPDAQAAVDRLHQRMDELDEKWSGSGFPTSREIASGLQY